MNDNATLLTRNQTSILLIRKDEGARVSDTTISSTYDRAEHMPHWQANPNKKSVSMNSSDTMLSTTRYQANNLFPCQI